MGQSTSSKSVPDGANTTNNNESNTSQMESDNENHNDQAVATDDQEIPIENNAPPNENNIEQHHGNEDESDTENEENQNHNDQAVETDDDDSDDEELAIEHVIASIENNIVQHHGNGDEPDTENEENQNHNDQAVETDDDSDDEELPIENIIAPSIENNVAQHHGNADVAVRRVRRGRGVRPVPPPRILLMYRCYPLSSITTTMAESHPASLILPLEALSLTEKHNVPWPLAFEVKNIANNKTTVCGVSEFTAEKGNCYVPDWIMENLGLTWGENVLVTYVKLPLGDKVLFQAQSVDFLDVSDPKKVLQSTLAKFHCISKDDIVPISGDGKVYKMKVLETKPADSICIRDIDLEVDFVAPVGYVEPNKEDPKETEVIAAYVNEMKFVPFSGLGHRMNGQPVERLQQLNNVSIQRGIPDNSWEFGTLNFIRTPKPSKNMSPGVVQKLTAFEGAGAVLGRQTKTNDHPPPEFDPLDEPPRKRIRTSGTSDPIGIIDESVIGDDFEVEEESEDSDMEIDED